MPLFELYGMTKENTDSAHKENPTSTTDSPFIPESDFAELVWENGPIMMQGQSSRVRKSSNGNISLQSHYLPSHSHKNRDRDVGNGTNSKIGKFGALDSILNEIPMSLNEDDEMGTWLNCQIDEPFQPEYNSDFLNELSGVTVNELSTQSNNNFAPFDRRSTSFNQLNKEFNSVSLNNGVSLEHENFSKISSVGGGNDQDRRARNSSNNPSYPSPSPSQQYHTPFTNLRPKDPSKIDNGTTSTNDNAGFHGFTMQKQDPRLRNCNNSGLINFSHFSRPASLYKANTQNLGMTPSCGSRMESVGNRDKRSAGSSNIPYPVNTTHVNSGVGLGREMSSNCINIEAKPPDEPPKDKIGQQDASEDGISKNRQNISESAVKGVPDGERTVEPIVASSSVGSGNSMDGVSDDPKTSLKRKHRDSENSECPSEDVEEESVGVKKASNARTGTGSKRSRAAEVHNLSERRRRDRINEKMRALQELIPNCNKVDKASMLDEAIEYLKTLQLQVQFMSMGAGLYMSPMMFAPGMPQMHAAAHMAHFSPMGLGMGINLGYGMGMPDMNGGSSSYPTVQVPSLHGPHFPGSPVTGPAALHGMPGSNFPLYGIPGQGHPISMPHTPLVPLSGGPMMKSAMGMNSCGVAGPINNVDSAAGSKSKSPMQNENSQLVQNAGANSSVVQSSNQVQATNESIGQPVEVQVNCQGAEVAGLKPLNSPNRDNNLTSTENGYD